MTGTSLPKPGGQCGSLDLSRKLPEDPGEGGWGGGGALGVCAGPWRCHCLARAQGGCRGLWILARASGTVRVPEQRASLPRRIADRSPGQTPLLAARQPRGGTQKRPRFPKLLPMHLPRVQSARLAKALTAGHKALPEGTVAPSPGLAFVPGSQNRPLDTKARLAQDSLAPGPELRPLGTELTRASVGTAPQLRATRDSIWAALALSGRSQCPSCGACLPGQLGS